MSTELTITMERIDDIMLLLEVMKRVGLPELLDRSLRQHELSQQAPCLVGTTNDENVASASHVVHSLPRQRARLARRSITRWYHESAEQADLGSLRYR